MTGEDPRARPAIDRLALRIMESPGPGVTFEAAREFAVGVARRNDIERPLNVLDDGRVKRSEARKLAKELIDESARNNPRVQSSIKRLAKHLHRNNPGTSAEFNAKLAADMLVHALVDSTPMRAMRGVLVEAILAAKPTRADGEAAARALLNPDELTAHLDAACTERPALEAPPPGGVYVETTLTIPITAEDYAAAG